MTATLSAEDIAAEVRGALEATLKLDAYPERLWPYTQAELNPQRLRRPRIDARDREGERVAR